MKGKEMKKEKKESIKEMSCKGVKESKGMKNEPMKEMKKELKKK